MNYQRKDPLDYKDIAENLRHPAWYDIENDSILLDDAATAITDLLARAEAAEARADRLAEELEAHSETELAKAHEALSADWAIQKQKAEAAQAAQETLQRAMAEYKARAEKAEKCIDKIETYLSFGKNEMAWDSIKEYRGKKEE